MYKRTKKNNLHICKVNAIVHMTIEQNRPQFSSPRLQENQTLQSCSALPCSQRTLAGQRKREFSLKPVSSGLPLILKYILPGHSWFGCRGERMVATNHHLDYLQRQTTDPLYHSSKLRGPFILFSSSLLLPHFDINSVCLSLSSLFMIFLLTKHDAKRLAKRSRWHSSLDSYSCKGGLGCVPFTRHSDCYAQSLRQMACLHAFRRFAIGLGPHFGTQVS